MRKIISLIMSFALTLGLMVITTGPAQAAPVKRVPCAVAHDGPYMPQLSILGSTFITDCRKYSALVDSVTVSAQQYRLEWDNQAGRAVLKPMGRGKTVTEMNDIAAVVNRDFCVHDAQYTIFFHTIVRPSAAAKRQGFSDPIFVGRNVTRPVRVNCDLEDGTSGGGPWGSGSGGWSGDRTYGERWGSPAKPPKW